MVAEAALIIALAALFLSGVAYWKAGGRRDVERALEYLRSRVEALGMKELELARKLHESIRNSYETARQGLLRARARRVDVRRQAATGQNQQLAITAEHIRWVERSVDQHLAELGLTPVPALRSPDQAISTRARMLEARADTILVKAYLLRAKSAAEKGELDRAETLLQWAIASLEEARRILGHDHEDAHVAEIEEGVRSLRDAMAAVRSKAEDARRRIDEVLTGSDSLVVSLEGCEEDPDPQVLFEDLASVASAEGTITLLEPVDPRAPAGGAPVASAIVR